MHAKKITLTNGASNLDVVASDETYRNGIAEGAHFDGATLTRISFVECDLYWASFSVATLSHVVFDNCDLRGADFADSTLDNCRFVRCDLGPDALGGKTVFDGADLSSVVFEGCNGP